MLCLVVVRVLARVALLMAPNSVAWTSVLIAGRAAGLFTGLPRLPGGPCVPWPARGMVFGFPL